MRYRRYTLEGERQYRERVKTLRAWRANKPIPEGTPYEVLNRAIIGRNDEDGKTLIEVKCSGMHSIIIPDGFTCLDSTAIMLAGQLKKVVLPKSMRVLEEHSLSCNKAVTDVWIQSPVKGLLSAVSSLTNECYVTIHANDYTFMLPTLIKESPSNCEAIDNLIADIFEGKVPEAELKARTTFLYRLDDYSLTEFVTATYVFDSMDRESAEAQEIFNDLKSLSCKALNHMVKNYRPWSCYETPMAYRVETYLSRDFVSRKMLNALAEKTFGETQEAVLKEIERRKALKKGGISKDA